ncbi:MAG TPA: lytic transglycosylase domain-containing protein [Burkholderiales bacterium]|nr:lytic transglycosylase domain-containing protein [Burkholderiales bacterium]
MNRFYRCALLALPLLLAALPGRADIFGFVDNEGVTHFSNVQLDSRYKLFKRDAASRPQLSYPGGNAAVEIRPSAIAQDKPYSKLIGEVARQEQMDAALLHAVITVESGYNPRALSPKGAAGLMQLMPETARRYAVSNIWDPVQNLRAGARYLRDLLAMFNDNLSLALAAYNAGEKAVLRAGNRIPPYAETRSYVPRVLEHYERYRFGV